MRRAASFRQDALWLARRRLKRKPRLKWCPMTMWSRQLWKDFKIILVRRTRTSFRILSPAGFTPDARNEARRSHVHVELIDLDRFIGLWQDFYDKLKEEDKSLLPL